MGIEEHRITIPALLERVEEACEAVDDVAHDAGMTVDAVYHCHLSVEEVCTNIIEHGYKFQGNNHMIEIVCRRYPDRFTITIMDDAAPFNPLTRPDPDPKAPLTERQTGGWGIFFVKKFMDHVTYKYEHNHNQLTLEKRL